jgi:hypothetical protein
MRAGIAALALLLACCPGARADCDGGSAPFDVLVFADPQPQTLVDVDYYRRDIVSWGVYANVYMGDDDTRVEYHGGEWRPMRKVMQPDPALLAENVRDDETDDLRGDDRSPEAEPSPHLWRVASPKTLAVGEHEIEVRAFDRWRGEQRATTRYRLEPVSPVGRGVSRSSSGHG